MAATLMPLQVCEKTKRSLIAALNTTSMLTGMDLDDMLPGMGYKHNPKNALKEYTDFNLR